jgi:hypothetical protein
MSIAGKIREMSAQPSAREQRAATKSNLASIERELVEVSDDPRRFQDLVRKRDVLKAELDRISYFEQREAEGQDKAHRQAVWDRYHESVAEARKIRERGVELDQQVTNLLDSLDVLLGEAGRLMVEHHRAEAAHLGAIRALKDLGEPVDYSRPRVGPWRNPSQAIATRVWGSAHRALHAAGVRPTSGQAMSAVQMAAAKKGT